MAADHFFVLLDDGAAPTLISSEKKTKAPKDRSNSDSSTESKKSFAKSFKSFVTRSPRTSPERSTVAPYVLHA